MEIMQTYKINIETVYILVKDLLAAHFVNGFMVFAQFRNVQAMG